MKALGLFLFLVVTLAAYQNCSPNQGMRSIEPSKPYSALNKDGLWGQSPGKDGSAGMSGGNSYDGKLQSNYYNIVSGHTCDGEPSAKQELRIRDGEYFLVENEDGQCGKETPIAAESIYAPVYKDIVVGRGKDIFEARKERLTSTSQSMVVWCEGTHTYTPEERAEHKIASNYIDYTVTRDKDSALTIIQPIRVLNYVNKSKPSLVEIGDVHLSSISYKKVNQRQTVVIESEKDLVGSVKGPYWVQINIDVTSIVKGTNRYKGHVLLKRKEVKPEKKYIHRSLMCRVNKKALDIP